jgi:ferrochelatase
MDKRVIDIPFFSRWMLVNLIIAPFRSPKSTKEYQKLWDERGSPLKYHTSDLTKKLQQKLGSGYSVHFAMRYQNPSIKKVLDEMKGKKITEIKVIPLFPQYASASSGSVVEEVMEISKNWHVIPKMSFEGPFHAHPLFIQAFMERAMTWMKNNEYDHFVFSYHGLPERQILSASVNDYCQLGACCGNLNERNAYCYRAQCFATTRNLAAALQIPKEKYTVCFQSRLGKDPWIKPYTDVVLKELPSSGVKRVLAFSPAFVADCLETTVEVGEMYKEDFIQAGGEQWDLVESLNTSDTWVNCLVDLASAN